MSKEAMHTSFDAYSSPTATQGMLQPQGMARSGHIYPPKARTAWARKCEHTAKFGGHTMRPTVLTPNSGPLRASPPNLHGKGPLACLIDTPRHSNYLLPTVARHLDTERLKKNINP